MSQLNPIFMYVGDEETGQRLRTMVETQGGYVYLPTEMLEVLGMYTAFMPDLVILDARWNPELVRTIHEHLCSIDAEPIVIVDQQLERWGKSVVLHDVVFDHLYPVNSVA